MTIVTNENGGKQSYVGTRFDLIPQDPLRDAAVVLHEGAEKYGEDNWKLISTNEHLNHALNHINLYMLKDTQEEHLSHALVRLMMACHVDLHGVVTNASRNQEDPTNTPQLRIWN